MESKEENPQNELAVGNDFDKQNIDSERLSKYKDMFDKHKNENGFINEEDINEILNEYGRKTTNKDTSELIKRVTQNRESTNIDFDNFVKLMESKDFESIIKSEYEQQPKKNLTNSQIYLFMLLLLITGSINTIANKLKQNTESLGVKYKGYQKIFSLFVCLLANFYVYFFIG